MNSGIEVPQEVQKIAAFSDGNQGGNPAGVMIAENHPSRDKMQQIAAAVGFSETAFAYPIDERYYRVRYFSPESEVPFCGHATIALGAALALKQGNGIFRLKLNETEITVEGTQQDGIIAAALQSPPTHSHPAEPELVSEMLNLFGYTREELDNDIPPALINAGANHLILSLKSREALATMTYDLNSGRKLMNREGLVTVILVYKENPQLFHTRNPFASGGVYEDPATGAATAAFAGYLRDIDWAHNGVINIVQGEDMGMRSLLTAEIEPEIGSSIRVSGTARIMEADE